MGSHVLVEFCFFVFFPLWRAKVVKRVCQGCTGTNKDKKWSSCIRSGSTALFSALSPDKGLKRLQALPNEKIKAICADTVGLENIIIMMLCWNSSGRTLYDL